MFKLRPNSVPYKIPLPNNMGIVRYVLALAVVFAHFKYLAGYDFYFPISSYSAIGGFFTLSGFLIYRSYLCKPNLKKYLLSRAIRILPAYWITVLFFALAFCFISTLSIDEYFSSSGFWKYLISNLAFLNFLHPTLPGVFEDLSTHAVNGSLWTMKVEWCLYLTPPLVVWLISRFKMKPTVMFVLVYIIACIYRGVFQYMSEVTGKELYYILGRQFFGQLSYFYAGVICYYWFDTFMHYKWQLIILAFAALFVCNFTPYLNIILHPFAIAIIIVWFSMVGKWGTWEGKHDNISYNIYLIHYPVIMFFVYLRGTNNVSLMPALLFCLLATYILSWLLNIIEIKIRHLLRKKYLVYL